MMIRRIIVALLLITGIAISTPVWAVVSDATNLFVIKKTGFVLNRRTNTYDTTVTLKNTSPFTVGVPVQLAVSGLSNGVTLANAAGTNQGKPYVNVNAPGNSILPNATITPIILKFRNPSRFALAPKLYVNGDIPSAAVDLPPDPGQAGKATVEGIDSNSNEVRDDVDRWIAFNYPDSEKTRTALMQEAVAFQKAAIVGKNHDSLRALDVDKWNGNSIACLNYVVGVDNMAAFSDRLLAETLNTSARIHAYDDYLALLPTFLTYDPPFGKAACTLLGFDPDIARD